MLFTIFTPTYNRAYTLPKLYESLKAQNHKNFVWLIVDDGSTDGTQDLIEGYKAEDKIPIRYYKQENKGKHIAVNEGLKYADTQWFCIIDSDDYLESKATEIWEELSLEIANHKNYAGFSFIHFSDKIIYDEKEYGNKRLSKVSDYKWEHYGEMLFCFKTDVISNFSFPIFPDEKFCQESVLFFPILRKYRILVTDHVLVHGEYLTDGLSQNHYASMLKSPNYGLLSIQEYFLDATTAKEKMYLAEAYWDIVLKSKRIPVMKALTGLPCIWTIKVFKDKILKKIGNR